MKKYSPIPFTDVSMDSGFWGPRLNTIRQRTIPIEYQQCKDTGRIDAFRLDWKPGRQPMPHIFWDSDVAKWIKAASYSLAGHPDAQLEASLEEVIELIVSAQQPDGYINTYFTVVEPKKRWTNLRDRHELYCAGHMIEAGVAHYQATGKRTLLEAVCRYADYIGSVFGSRPEQKHGYPGHEEIELALVRLFRVTGERRFLDLSLYFINERGRQPYYYDLEARQRGEDPKDFRFKTYAYMQAHLPVREQREVVGHAVRAMYLYSAMADLAGETGDESLIRACEALWQDVCLRKMYLTGGIGPSTDNEGFTLPYDLPNETAYAETCAAIGLVFRNQRMLQLECDSRYADAMERALYNGVLSGVSLDGERFFYVNPLASKGNLHRQPWFDCACCPPNLARLFTSLAGYIYSCNESTLAVHLYIQNSASISIAGQMVTVHQETNYPWSGEVNISMEMEEPARFALSLRLPGWCHAAKLFVNREDKNFDGLLQRGYIRLEQNWQPGDTVMLELQMPVERMYAHPQARADVGQVALQRGPLVYCLEEVDQDMPVERIGLPKDSPLSAQYNSSLLGGVVEINGTAAVLDSEDWEGTLYRPQPASLRPCFIKAIPYYAWDNRRPGSMSVWMAEF